LLFGRANKGKTGDDEGRVFSLRHEPTPTTIEPSRPSFFGSKKKTVQETQGVVTRHRVGDGTTPALHFDSLTVIYR
jgi:hypothetical protein